MKAVLAAGFRAREEYHEMLVMQLRFDRLVVALRVLLAIAVQPAQARGGRLRPRDAAEVLPPKNGRRAERARRGAGRNPGETGADGNPGERRCWWEPRREGASAETLGETGCGPESGGGRRWEPGRDLGFYTL